MVDDTKDKSLATEENNLSRVPSGKEDLFLIHTKSRDERGGRGSQMAEANPYVEKWAKCFNGAQPLMDIGCAYGSNVDSAASFLASDDASECKVKILAADFEDSHLDYVNNLHILGVETVRCKLPNEMPTDEVKSYGGLSGILVSEVLHFCTGSEIDASLSWMFNSLVPGGKLFITACSPYIGGAWSADKHEILTKQREGIRQGLKWPLSPDNSFGPMYAFERERLANPESLKIRYGDDYKEILDALPVTMHLLDWELVDACREVGFQILEAKLAWRDGYPEGCKFDGREMIHIIAMKPDESIAEPSYHRPP